MRLGLSQINATVGDLDGNTAKIIARVQEARAAQCRLVAFPELALTGYPPQDLVLKPRFIQDEEACLTKIAQECQGITAVVGCVSRNPQAKGRRLYNSAAFLQAGQAPTFYNKMLIPTYDVFDEARYFEPGEQSQVIKIDDERVAVTICEDIWNVEGFPEATLYNQKPLALAVQQGAQWILNISASPFHLGKTRVREALIQKIAALYHLPVVYLNLVGGNDGLIFDGHSLVADQAGKVVVRGRSCAEDFLIVDIKDGTITGETHATPLDEVAEARAALVLGLRDYVEKCGFKNVVLGLSGGIDSALVACLAVEALGAERVWAIGMPSRYSSPESLTDAVDLAKNLRIRFDVLPIEKPFAAFLDLLAPLFKDLPPNTAEENLQARIRGTLLMALSNKFGHLLLSTGNKSEMSVGYTTLYGDMNGGLAVIGDVPKTLVYRLAEAYNAPSKVIPQNIITRPPSAELRPDQSDQDTLPPYADLDRVLKRYIEEEKSPGEIATLEQLPRELVRQIVEMTDRAEYKRRQAPPTLRITSKAFGTGRRLPIAQRFRHEI